MKNWNDLMRLLVDMLERASKEELRRMTLEHISEELNVESTQLLEYMHRESDYTLEEMVKIFLEEYQISAKLRIKNEK